MQERIILYGRINKIVFMFSIKNGNSHFNRDWMEGPMTGVDPDDVENEVGNFWRGLYKLEKGFDSVPSAKKIAGKVCALGLKNQHSILNWC